MKYFIFSFCFITIIFLFNSILNKADTIEQLEIQLEHNNCVIDSLHHEIDTLQWENQIWDFNL